MPGVVKRRRAARSGSATTHRAARSPAERKVWDRIDKARLTIKRALRDETRAEVVSADILNFRIRG